MNDRDHARLGNLTERARGEGWTLCVLDLLDYFADLATDQRARDLAESFSVLSKNVPAAAAFFFDILPLIVLANHPEFQRMDQVALEAAHPEWNDVLSDALLDPTAFEATLEGLMQSGHESAEAP